jgi:hypothetical protein
MKERHRTQGQVGAVVTAMLVAGALAGCGESAAKSASTAATAPLAGDSTASTPATPQAVRHAQRPGTTSTGTTAANAAAGAPSPHGVKPEDQLGKTSFLKSAGRGFAAFHRYVSIPLRKHVFEQTGTAGSEAIAKGAVAASFAARELRAAAAAAGTEAAVAQLAGPLDSVSHGMESPAA